MNRSCVSLYAEIASCATTISLSHQVSFPCSSFPCLPFNLFSSVYDASMPSTLPKVVLAKGLAQRLIGFGKRTLRYLLVAFCWLALVPYSVKRIWVICFGDVSHEDGASFLDDDVGCVELVFFLLRFPLLLEWQLTNSQQIDPA